MNTWLLVYHIYCYGKQLLLHDMMTIGFMGDSLESANLQIKYKDTWYYNNKLCVAFWSICCGQGRLLGACGGQQICCSVVVQ